METKKRSGAKPSPYAALTEMLGAEEAMTPLAPIEARLMSIVNTLWSNVCLSVRIQTDGTIRPFDAAVIAETSRSAMLAAIELEGQLRTLMAGLESKRRDTPHE